MRCLKFIMIVIIMLTMEQPALGAAPANVLDDVMAVVPVPFSEILVVLGLGLVGLSVIARR